MTIRPMSTSDTSSGESTTEVRDLVAVMVRTLPEAGMDRVTDLRMEELLAAAALTAHF